MFRLEFQPMNVLRRPYEPCEMDAIEGEVHSCFFRDRISNDYGERVDYFNRQLGPTMLTRRYHMNGGRAD